MAHALWMDPSIKLEQRARVCSTFNFIKTMPRFHEIESTGYLMLVTDLNLTKVRSATSRTNGQIQRIPDQLVLRKTTRDVKSEK